jgi:subtilisin family serine protease
MALPDRIYGQASTTSLGGRSLFEPGKKIRPYNVVSFSSAPTVVKAARQRLEDIEFEILQVTPYTINFAASPEAIEKATRTKIIEREFERPNGGSVTVLDSPDTSLLGLVSTYGTPIADVVEGIALEAPRDLMAPNPTPPFVNYFHLGVPSDVASAANAPPLHRLGITGAGVKVAMVDSGWYRHPYFAAQGYQVAPVTLAPGASDPEEDESGHGTGESANILALAPGCTLFPVKANFNNTIAAFNAAVALNPDIITCSWGSDRPFELSAPDLALEAAVASAVASGIIVIFSAGNGHAGFPGQHPDVISAGGAIMNADGSLEASNYSSGFRSLIYPDRRVPDVCGLVGNRPKAIYIMLPVQPGDQIDLENSGSEFPDGDETAADDGWAAFSGTSAAAPQLAGAAALIKQVVPTITPSGVKEVLGSTARDVAAGFCSRVSVLHNGLPALPGDDDATGPGLVDATEAATYAYTQSITGRLDTELQTTLVLQAAAYYQGVSDASSTAASVLAGSLLGTNLKDFAAASSALAQGYWSSVFD